MQSVLSMDIALMVCLTQEDIDTGNYITDGLVPQAGDIKYVDLDGDGKLTDKDRTYIGCDVPDITYGVNLNLRYKGFELSMFGQGVTGTKVNFSMEMPGHSRIMQVRVNIT